MGFDLIIELWFYLWIFFRILFFVLLCFFLFNGIEELVLDMTFYIRLAYRHLFKRKYIKPLTKKDLDAESEQWIAIMVPAWDESNVIGHMLLNTLNTVEYNNYYIFVGTYPNDEATINEVNKVKEIFPNVRAVVTPMDGPTNKSDCLNWTYQDILYYQKENNMKFDIFLMHDSEDVIHPLSLKYYNYLMPRFVMVQIPVFPLELKGSHWVSGIYMDEFAESHFKDMRVREMISGRIPSAGVGTGLSSGAIDFLAKNNKNQVFDITSVTEDYFMGINLGKMEGEKIFFQQSIRQEVEMERIFSRKKYMKEKDVLVATREFFPNNVAESVRQKARWVLGIAIQGWSLGWTGNLGTDYYLFKDRKGFISNLLNMCGYVLLLYWLLAVAVGNIDVRFKVPPLFEESDYLSKYVPLVTILLFWRLCNRFLCVSAIYSPKEAIFSIPRFILGNFVNFLASIEALKRFIKAKISGKVPEWGKTKHAYPSQDQLKHFRKKIGAILVDRNFIKAEDVEAALDLKEKEPHKKLGEILIESGRIWKEDLLWAIVAQKDKKFVELSPLKTPVSVLNEVKFDTLQLVRVFPLKSNEKVMVVAADMDREEIIRNILSEEVKKKIDIMVTTSEDIDYAHKYLAEIYSNGKFGEPSDEIVRHYDDDYQHYKDTVSPKKFVDALRYRKREGGSLDEVLANADIKPQNFMA